MLLKSSLLLALAAAIAGAQECPVSSKITCDPTKFMPAPEKFSAKFQTDAGDFVLEVLRENAPREADRLYNLISLGYYNDMRFFRVNGKVVQFGVHALKDMNRNVYSETCTNPNACFISDPMKISNTRGTISFAANVREDFCTASPDNEICSSPDEGGLILTNEIFINTIDNPAYDTVGGTGFAPVGQIVSGMSVVDEIYGGYGEFNDPELCARVPDVPCAGPDYKLYQDGNGYFDANFPKMTKLIRTTILPEKKDCPAKFNGACDPSTFDPAPLQYTVKFETNVGDFNVEVDRDTAPKSADRLYNLVRMDYYNDQRFFRVNGKVIQYGVHALKEMNREFYNEDCSRPGSCFVSDVNKLSNMAGTIAFAANVREDLCTNINPFADVCSDPDEGGLVLTNEIFINTIDNPVYDTVGGTGFAAFGKVTPDTMEVVKKIFGGYGEFNDPELCAKVPDVPCAGPDYKLYQDGNSYFDPTFPKMTKLLRASIASQVDEKPAAPSAFTDVQGPWATPATADPSSAPSVPSSAPATPTSAAAEATVASEPSVPSAESAPAAPVEEDGSGMSGGGIAGIVIAVLVLVAGAVAGGVFFLRRKRQQRWAESAYEFQ